jgi:hypothetical protein
MMRGELPHLTDEELQDDEAVDEHMAITTLLDAGHTFESIGNMSPTNFHGFVRAAKWLYHRKLADSHLTAIRAAVAGFRGKKETFDELEKLIKEMRTAHKNV